MNNEDYLNYLKTRSWISFVYRKYFLYPTLCKILIGKTLDIGCGIGDFLRCHQNCEGVDVNESLVRYCQSINLSAHHMSKDLLPYENKAFQNIILDNVLEHLEEPHPLLSEIFRVLNEKGFLVIGVPGVKGYTKDSDHKIFYDEFLLRSTLEKHHFKMINIFSMPFNLKILSPLISSYCLYAVFEKQ